MDTELDIANSFLSRGGSRKMILDLVLTMGKTSRKLGKYTLTPD